MNAQVEAVRFPDGAVAIRVVPSVVYDDGPAYVVASVSASGPVVQIEPAEWFEPATVVDYSEADYVIDAFGGRDPLYVALLRLYRERGGSL